MEIKFNYKPGDKVFFLHENKVVQGEIDSITTKSYLVKDEGKTSVVYTVVHKYKKEKDESAGFLSEERYIEKYLQFPERDIFSTKEDLIKSL